MLNIFKKKEEAVSAPNNAKPSMQRSSSNKRPKRGSQESSSQSKSPTDTSSTSTPTPASQSAMEPKQLSANSLLSEIMSARGDGATLSFSLPNFPRQSSSAPDAISDPPYMPPPPPNRPPGLNISASVHLDSSSNTTVSNPQGKLPQPMPSSQPRSNSGLEYFPPAPPVPLALPVPPRLNNSVIVSSRRRISQESTRFPEKRPRTLSRSASPYEDVRQNSHQAAYRPGDATLIEPPINDTVPDPSASMPPMSSSPVVNSEGTTPTAVITSDLTDIRTVVPPRNFSASIYQIQQLPPQQVPQDEKSCEGKIICCDLCYQRRMPHQNPNLIFWIRRIPAEIRHVRKDCDICGIDIAAPISRDISSKVHCYKCNSDFDRIDRLLSLSFVHTDVKPHRCPQPKCSKSYTRQSRLSEHLERAHNITASKVHAPAITSGFQ